MSQLSLKQIIIIAGFVLILISIPLMFIMIKNTQIFKSRASEIKRDRFSDQEISAEASGSAQEVPEDSPLSTLQSLLQNASPSAAAVNDISPTPTTAPNLAFGPTLNLKIALEGRQEGKQAAKIFIGIGSGSSTTKPTYVLSFTIDVPDTGMFSGISLAGLNPGSTYTAYVKGPSQIDSSSTFIMSPTETNLNSGQALNLLSGDLNEDNTVNSADYTIAKNIYGATSSSSNWNSRADFNGDRVINNLDLSILMKNFGKIGASGIWYSSIPTATSSATPTVTNSGSPQDNSHSSGYWIWVP